MHQGVQFNCSCTANVFGTGPQSVMETSLVVITCNVIYRVFRWKHWCVTHLHPWLLVEWNWIVWICVIPVLYYGII